MMCGNTCVKAGASRGFHQMLARRFKRFLGLTRAFSSGNKH